VLLPSSLLLLFDPLGSQRAISLPNFLSSPMPTIQPTNHDKQKPQTTTTQQGALALCVARCTTEYDLERLELLLDPALSPINPMCEGPHLLRNCRAWLKQAAEKRARDAARAHQAAEDGAAAAATAAAQAEAAAATSASSSSGEAGGGGMTPAKAAMGAAIQEQREALMHKVIGVLEGALARRHLAYHLCRARTIVDAAAALVGGNPAAVPACLRGRVGGPAPQAPLPQLTLVSSAAATSSSSSSSSSSSAAAEEATKDGASDGLSQSPVSRDGRYMAVLSYTLGLDTKAHLPSDLFEEVGGFLKGLAWNDPDWCPYDSWCRERKRARRAAEGAGAVEGSG
jgi:hypothetical protein